MYTLGISCYYHDSSAALLCDGKIIAAAEEERFSRKKHDSSFPKHAIQFCLETAGITAKDIDYVAFYEKPLIKFERILMQHIAHFPRSLKTFVGSMPSWINTKLRIRKTIRKQIGYTGPVVFIPHHVSHAASAFYPSPFREAATVTIDGVGEWSTTTIGHGTGAALSLIKELRFPHSLGLLYSTITAFLGFSVNNSEYKVMGLSAYGNKDKNSNPYYEKLSSVIDWKPDGSFVLDLQYFRFHYSDRMPSRRLESLLGMRRRGRNDALTQNHKDLAAALQLLTEEIVLALVDHAIEVTKCTDVVLAGGVALNSVANGKILSGTRAEQIWIQPNSSDGGTSLGAALFAAHHYNRIDREPFSTPYLGSTFSDADIETYLRNQDVHYTAFASTEDLLEQVSTLLHESNVLGWFQGGAEWGPRALGGRSILANPTDPNMQEVLNRKVKKREAFRPFAPTLPVEDMHHYFVCDDPLPEAAHYMLQVYPLREEVWTRLSSITHVDGSGRPQAVARKQNPLYYDLLRAFEQKSGTPVLINTSFNIRGEPIVNTPHDAFRCMMGTEIDYLVMGNFLIPRSENIHHAWVSSVDQHE